MIYAIGDVHGCVNLLRRLFALIRADAQSLGIARPRVVLLGDLIDRGPASRGVLDLVLSHEVRDAFALAAVRGNHEQFLLDAERELGRAQTWLLNGGAETVESYGVLCGGSSAEDVALRFFRRFPGRHRAFLESLPLHHHEDGLFFVHAGVTPDTPLEAQQPKALLWIREPFLSHPRDFGARVVHGHSVTPSGVVEAHPNRIAVDTGCGFQGGRLSAAAIAPDGAVRTLAVQPKRYGALDD